MHDLPNHKGTVVDKDPNAFPLTAIDRQILSMTDQEYQLTSWDELTDIISSNRLEELKRKPSDLRRYIAWSTDIKAKYGGITNFVVKERLHWEPLPSPPPPHGTSGPPTFAFENQIPFADSRDFAILRNDWPYGLAEDITHLCVWTKTPIATDDDTGDVTPESRRFIEDFVRRTFATPLDALYGEGKGGTAVLWFKNWVALQSVRGVDHIHVMLRDVPKHIVDDWTM